MQHPLKGLLITGGVVLLFVGLSLVVAQHWITAPGTHSATTVMIKRGESLYAVSERLEAEELISSAKLLRLYARVQGLEKSIRAGEYLLPARASLRQIIHLLVSGRVVQFPVRIREGLTISEVIEDLASYDVLEQRLSQSDLTQIRAAVGIELPFVEGSLLPDTYYVQRGSTDVELFKRAHRAMLDALLAQWGERSSGLILTTPAEALILASLIEKESSLKADRGLISQVFHRRLKKNMRLQTDPTVIYALGERFDGDLRRADLRVDSRFNTYKYKGLPPTPIALPSVESIRAALHPTEGKYLYFVARGDGSSHFSLTLAEHNAAVRRYQLGRNRR